ncbi:MAG TPA: glycosyltransferase family 2 protein [Candidatus Woesebacteria bacterium]|nr:glycosyltransferase family 2 protein [Candidatus Woesebacteria bacterium]
MPKSPKKTDLSVIILNYNSGDYLLKCAQSINQADFSNYQLEFIFVDNNSNDESFFKIKSYLLKTNLNYQLLPLKQNLGFATGNNQGIKLISPDTRYVLFLNPDTTVETDTFSKMISFFDQNPQVDAATCHVNLVATGKLQPETHRGFPNPWNTFWHFFGFGLPKIFPKWKLINGYLMSYLDYSKVQKIDCCVGAFFMMKKTVGQAINWWNEKYFFYGEDLDFCYKLHQKGYQLFFYPGTKINHYQGVSSGIIKQSKNISSASIETKINSAKASTQAMRIFYSENLINKYPKALQFFIWQGINFLEKYRIWKAKKS